MPERRVRRSSNPLEALTCWLEASRNRTQLSSLALADSLGILVAGAGPARECDVLAAWAPVVMSGSEWPEQPPFPVCGAKVPGFDAYVCAESRGETAEEALADTAAGCSRILRGN